MRTAAVADVIHGDLEGRWRRPARCKDDRPTTTLTLRIRDLGGQ